MKEAARGNTSFELARRATTIVACVLGSLGVVAGCASPQSEGSDGTNSAFSGAPSSGPSASHSGNVPPPAAGSGAAIGNGVPAPSGGDDDTAPSTTKSQFTCTGQGIAAFADALANRTRAACTSDGTGVVKEDNYQCIQTPINRLAPPYPDLAFQVIDTLLGGNTQYPNLECTYFVQAVTAAVCNNPITPTGGTWQDYPFASDFANSQAEGFTWIPNDGSTQVEVGDIFIYDTTGGQDPGHIMIVAEIVSDGQFRIAEANENNPDGSRAFGGETGAVTNTRVAGLDDGDNLAGWYRVNAQ
jgi:hypothetical protein